MENLDRFILDLALIMVTAAVMTLVFRKLKQPVVLGYIIAGFLISPNFTLVPTVVETSNISTWANIGIVFLMFGLGLEFNFKKIFDVGKSAIITAITVMASMVIVGLLIGQLLGWSFMTSLFLGGMLSMSSTMIILKTYEDLDLKDTNFGKIVLGALVIEDIGGIFMMIVLATVAVGKGDMEVTDIVLKLGIMVLYLAVWLILGVYVIPTLMRMTRKLMNDEVMLVFSMAVCLGMVVVADLIGFSSALGAFLGGSIIGGTIYSEKVDSLVKPIKDMFGAVFFVSVGMMIDPHMLWKYLVPIVILTAVTIVGQGTFATIGMIMSGQNLHTAVRGGLSMVQIGEFSFILATMGDDMGVTEEFLYPMIVCISVITIFTTPVFIKSAEGIYGFLDKRLPRAIRVKIRQYNTERAESKENDNNWVVYLKQYFTRTIICAAILVTVYILGFQVFMPFVENLVPGVIGTIITDLAILILMGPVIVIMCSRKSINYTRLWTVDRSNRLPLVMLDIIRIAFCVFAVSGVVIKSFHIPVLAVVPVAVIAVILTVRSDFMKTGAIRMELKFITNMNAKVLEMSKRERGLTDDYSWLDLQIHVCGARVNKSGEGMFIRDIRTDLFSGITVIKIVRGNMQFNMPGPEFEMREGDVLHIMGIHEKLDPFIYSIGERDDLSYPVFEPVTLRDYISSQPSEERSMKDQIICCPIILDRGSEFVRKPIKNCGFREKYKGFIIGIERSNFPIPNPDLNLMIETGDLLWVIGTREMGEKLLLAGYLDPKKLKRKKPREKDIAMIHE